MYDTLCTLQWWTSVVVTHVLTAVPVRIISTTTPVHVSTVILDTTVNHVSYSHVCYNSLLFYISSLKFIWVSIVCYSLFSDPHCGHHLNMFWRSTICVSDVIPYFVTTEKVDECASSPCENGATCRDECDQFVCECDFNYQGTLCAAGTLHWSLSYYHYHCYNLISSLYGPNVYVHVTDGHPGLKTIVF